VALVDNRNAAGWRKPVPVPLFHDGELNRDVVLDGIPPYMGIKSTAGELYMRVQIDENSVTLTPFGSLIRINPANATDEHKSWLEILRTALSHHREKRSDEMPVAD